MGLGLDRLFCIHEMPAGEWQLTTHSRPFGGGAANPKAGQAANAPNPAARAY
ncbi:hypothetical protein GGR46_000974 [Sphingomonas kyeonggiensis]|uniref:Uncharacterized protein n=1 Tax=Sphingomonas kyeonggiensis TaxID=1268553 RepID=A0A7W6JS19_9SPHN|nr:hypothetical protein [Sphingomonas kyeonggiensis]